VQRGSRVSIITLASATLVGGLVGCAPDTPEFVPPMVWAANEHYRPGKSVGDHVVVRVFEDGRARLQDFPVGQSVREDAGTYCIDGLTDERYPGDATWEVRNRFSFWVDFEDSRVLVSGDAQFDEQDWSTIGFNGCGGERWDFAYVCGDSRYGDDDNTTTFRDECPIKE
jgi:hypothetical protein